MKKNLIILISALLIICVFVVYFVINYRNMQMETQINNKEYIEYEDKTIVGTTLVSLINKTVDNNEKNNIEKDDQNVYIENEPLEEALYIVKRGDTLSQIALNYNTTVNAIARENGISNPNLIYPGQRLIIQTQGNGTELGHSFYRVVRGDTLY